jgi:hypothetical protein
MKRAEICVLRFCNVPDQGLLQYYFVISYSHKLEGVQSLHPLQKNREIIFIFKVRRVISVLPTHELKNAVK